jgi:hypothetical protein
MTGLQASTSILKQFVFFSSPGKKTFGPYCSTLFLGLALVHWLCSRRYLAHWWRAIPDWSYAALLGVGGGVALYFVPADYKQFIYFQF